MSNNGLEVADILRLYGEAYRQEVGHLSSIEQRVIRDLTLCRTSELGGHLYACDQCGVIIERYNSCRNRHCPKCQALERARWLEKREQELLPVPYFHLVFTVPHSLNPLFLADPKALYNLLFRSSAQALSQLALDPKRLGARIGFLSVLHSWGQRMELHPHTHVIVPGGGLSIDGEKWVASRPRFFVRVEPLAKLFRGKFLDAVKQAAQQHLSIFPRRLDPQQAHSAYQKWLDELYSTPWVVYSKPPFGGASGGLNYLARYTHRVAISNYRLIGLEGDRVIFRWKDYRAGGEVKTTSLDATEFIRRFVMHVLPPGFQRIRYYGLFANRYRSVNLERCRRALGVTSTATEEAEPDDDAEPAQEESWEEELERLTGVDPLKCPVCGEGRLLLLETVPSLEELLSQAARAPPEGR